jgi:hypothetical protein
MIFRELELGVRLASRTRCSRRATNTPSGSIGHDPATGKLKRAYFYSFYSKTRQEAADPLVKAFVAPLKLTMGEWLNT